MTKHSPKLPSRPLQSYQKGSGAGEQLWEKGPTCPSSNGAHSCAFTPVALGFRYLVSARGLWNPSGQAGKSSHLCQSPFYSADPITVANAWGKRLERGELFLFSSSFQRFQFIMLEKLWLAREADAMVAKRQRANTRKSQGRISPPSHHTQWPTSSSWATPPKVSNGSLGFNTWAHELKWHGSVGFGILSASSIDIWI